MKLKVVIIIVFFAFVNLLKAQNKNLELLSVNDLRSKSLKELRFIRNDVFARHGYIFKDTELKAFFSKKYKNMLRSSTSEVNLTNKEKEYVALVKQIEKGKKVTSKNKILLEILALLPEKSRGSWDWSKEDRKVYMKASIKEGYLSNNNSGMFQKRFISDSYFFIGVIDGSWSLKLFKAKDNSYLVLAVDHVGDGNSFTTYTYKNGKLYQREKDFLELLPKQLFISFYSNKNNCSENYEDNYGWLLEYTFNEDIIELYDFYAKNNKECFNYDTVILKFNKDTKQFELKEAYWE